MYFQCTYFVLAKNTKIKLIFMFSFLHRYEIYTTPKMVMCSPRNVAHNALNIFSKEALATFPVPIQSKPKKEIKVAPQKKKKVPKAMAGIVCND